jgi:hypothetical protein
MKRVACLLVLGLGVLGVSAVRGAGDKGTVVELGGLKSQAPADWKQQEIPERLRQFRIYQFQVPKAEGDTNDAELLIFHLPGGQGGSAEDNVKRWKGMFVPPEGKNIDDVSKVEKMKVGNVDVTYLDVQGTYLFKQRPFDPGEKPEKRPGYRMLGVVFETENGPHFIRFVGPAKTVEQHKKGFEGWLKAFK